MVTKEYYEGYLESNLRLVGKREGIGVASPLLNRPGKVSWHQAMAVQRLFCYV